MRGNKPIQGELLHETLDPLIARTLTAAGRKQLQEQTNRWDEIVHAINRVLRPA